MDAEPIQGLTPAADPLRYGGQEDDPNESTGIILKAVPKNSRVFDVGCGTGSISCMIKDKRSCDVTGLEPNSIRAAAAREKGLEVINALFSPEAVADLNPYDVVIFADVLEHLVNPAEAVALAKKCLKPGGILIASVPNIAHWSVRIDLIRGHFNYRDMGIMDATHLRWFTQESIRRFFESTGYTVQKISGSAGLWMSDYKDRKPWKWIPKHIRRKIVLFALKRYPSLFACQFIVICHPSP